MHRDGVEVVQVRLGATGHDKKEPTDIYFKGRSTTTPPLLP